MNFPPKFNALDCYRCALASDAAYQDGVNVTAALAQLNAQQVIPFESEATDTQGLLIVLDNTVLIAFRGTSDLHDVLTDCRFRFAYVDGNGVHAGVESAWESVYDDVVKLADLYVHEKRLLVCGHSLGGGIAERAALSLSLLTHQVDGIYTFGALRVGSRAFRDAYNARLGEITFRVVNGYDPIPWLPGVLIGYRHVGHEIFYKGGQIQFDPPICSKIGTTAWELYTQMRSHVGPEALALALKDVHEAGSAHHMASYRTVATFLKLSQPVGESVSSNASPRLSPAGSPIRIDARRTVTDQPEHAVLCAAGEASIRECPPNPAPVTTTGAGVTLPKQEKSGEQQPTASSPGSAGVNTVSADALSATGSHGTAPSSKLDVSTPSVSPPAPVNINVAGAEPISVLVLQPSATDGDLYCSHCGRKIYDHSMCGQVINHCC